MNIQPLEAFDDNYIWMFRGIDSNKAYVVDPGDANVVETALASEGLELAGILVTHHHFDHTGGIAQLTEDRNIPVYGAHNSLCEQVTHKLKEGDRLALESNLNFEVIEVPGHTLDHIAFHSAEDNVLFCGDTLFVAGCGRIFEGTPEQMLASLEKLANLPGATKVFCTHEYTMGNLDFAMAVEPNNAHIQETLSEARHKRASNSPTVPSTISAELEHNPFLRSRQPDVIESARRQSNPSNIENDIDVFAAIRRWKDVF